MPGCIWEAKGQVGHVCPSDWSGTAALDICTGERDCGFCNKKVGSAWQLRAHVHSKHIKVSPQSPARKNITLLNYKPRQARQSVSSKGKAPQQTPPAAATAPTTVHAPSSALGANVSRTVLSGISTSQSRRSSIAAPVQSVEDDETGTHLPTGLQGHEPSEEQQIRGHKRARDNTSPSPAPPSRRKRPAFSRALSEESIGTKAGRLSMQDDDEDEDEDVLMDDDFTIIDDNGARSSQRRRSASFNDDEEDIDEEANEDANKTPSPTPATPKQSKRFTLKLKRAATPFPLGQQQERKQPVAKKEKEVRLIPHHKANRGKIVTTEGKCMEDLEDDMEEVEEELAVRELKAKQRKIARDIRALQRMQAGTEDYNVLTKTNRK